MAKILIVEDDDQVAQLYIDWLTSAEHVVDRSAAAYGAVQRMLRATLVGLPYDLVLMDLMLQGANGAVAALALRGLGYLGPIVVVTGGLMPIDQAVQDRAGFALRLQKPLVQASDLLDPIAKLLEPRVS